MRVIWLTVYCDANAPAIDRRHLDDFVSICAIETPRDFRSQFPGGFKSWKDNCRKLHDWGNQHSCIPQDQQYGPCAALDYSLVNKIYFHTHGKWQGCTAESPGAEAPDRTHKKANCQKAYSLKYMVANRVPYTLIYIRPGGACATGQDSF